MSIPQRNDWRVADRGVEAGSERGEDCPRVLPHHAVRPEPDGDWTLRRDAQREAWDAKNAGLLLNATGISQHRRGMLDKVHEGEVTKRLDEPQPSDGRLRKSRSCSRVDGENDRQLKTGTAERK